MTIQRMRIECWIKKGYKHTLRICNSLCLFTATMVTRMPRSVTLYVHCLTCYFHLRFVIIIIIICLLLIPALFFFSCIPFLPSSFLLNSLRVFPSSLFPFSFLPFLFTVFFVPFFITARFFLTLSLCLSISCVSSDVYLFLSMLHCSAFNYLFLVLTFFL